VTDPHERLELVSGAMEGLKESGQAVGAEAITRLGDFAPPTIMAQAARLQARQRVFNLVVTNVPGPQIELYLHGKRLIDAFPMVPLAKNQAVGVALLSYAGNINFGLVGDYDLMWDLDDFADDVSEALAELADAAGVELTAMTAPSGQAVRA
jgi:diacylglycerol O-acyltransferase